MYEIFCSMIETAFICATTFKMCFLNNINSFAVNLLYISKYSNQAKTKIVQMSCFGGAAIYNTLYKASSCMVQKMN